MTTHEELKEAVGFLFDDKLKINTELYFVMKDMSLRKVDMGVDLESGLTTRILSTVSEEIISDDNRVFGPMSESDDKTKALCYYDLGPIPDELAFFVGAVAQPDTKDFEYGTDDLGDVFGYVFRLGNDGKNVTLFKKHQGFDTIKRGSRTILLVPVPSKTRMERFQSDAIKLTGDFDLMLVNEALIVLKVKLMENTFKVDKLIRDKAAGKLAEIAHAGLVSDISKLEKALEKLPNARKLNKASRTSTVLQLAHHTVTGFIRGHKTLKEELPIDATSGKIEVKTNAHVKQFLKLLDDDFLRSDLTNEEYEALLKKRLGKKK